MDIKNHIFQPKQKETDTKTYKAYCWFGEHDHLDEDNNPVVDKDDKKALAKIVTFPSGSQKFYIKVGQYGRIYNPIGMYSEGNNNKFLSKIGKNAWEFKEVNKNIFDLYINFLRTKNIAWLNNAERGML